MLDLADVEMLLWNADLTDSLRENADKNRFFYLCFFCLLELEVSQYCQAERPRSRSFGTGEAHTTISKQTKN
ncbi:hypothetical protein B0A72_06865 [Flavobacterium pectinovorum]|uniref:Uncharacterized protein n=1 Tax=Flavobacterium pectinovorum TaxID=29533 RepID=A0AB36P319_9FLAO|nr:hypothetical protein B0A72_06865 [Flavobacterium pectinovorum]